MRYLDMLTESDLSVLAASAGHDPTALAADLCRRPWALADLLGNPALLDELIDPRRGIDTSVSPFLLFAAAVFHAAADLRSSTFVSEWAGPRWRIPVFGVDDLCEFLDDPARCLFLADLLCSFASPDHTRPGGLDPLRLAARLDAAGDAQRPQLLRSLGDLALFLAGVLPDYTGSHPLSPVETERLGRAAGLASGHLLSMVHHPAFAGLELMEILGQRWYRLSAEATRAGTAEPPIVADVANRFSAGRRVLTHLSDRYLFHIQPQWLAMSA